MMAAINSAKLVIALTLLLLISCSGQQKKDTTDTHVIRIKQMRFVPETLTVSQGDSVTWINKDIVAHNIKSDSPEGWKSPKLKQGESYTVKIIGETNYICTLHPVMKGNIQVQH